MNYTDEFVYRAQVEDETQEYFEVFDKNVRQQAEQVDNTNAAIQTGADKSSVALGAVIGVVSTLTMKLVNMAMQAGAAFVQFANDSVELAARVETLGINVYRIGERMGYSKEYIDSTVESLKDLGITTQGAYNSLLLLSRANIDWSEATKLARVAQDAAVIAGINSSQAFERLARGIQKMEPELLDELGITLNRTTAYQAYSAVIGKTAKELTELEKKQAILNEIYRQAEVVGGSYEASMGTAGKQAQSLARHVEELQLAIGNAFLPVYEAKIQFMTAMWKEMRRFIDENSEALSEFGTYMGDSLVRGGKIILKLMELVIKLGGAYRDLNEKVSEFRELLVGEETLTKYEKWKQNIMTTVGQVVSFIAGSITFAINAVLEVANTAATLYAGVADVLIGRMSLVDFGKLMHDMTSIEHLTEMYNNAKDAADNAFMGTAEFLGLVEETGDAAATTADDVEDLGGAIEDMADITVEAVDVMEQAANALERIRESTARSEADRLRQEHRQAIEEAIRLSQQREDIERRYLERIAKIRQDIEKRRTELIEDYNDSVAEAAEEHTKRRIEIELNYQERLRQIHKDFMYDSEELARNRDAVGMVRLIRENKRKLEEEEHARDLNLENEDKSYQERLQALHDNLIKQQQALDESLQEQLQAAEEARDEDYRNLELSLERNRRLKLLHDQWAEEDRRIALQRQLQDWFDHYKDLDGVTISGLAKLLGSWRSYLDDVELSVNDSMEIVRNMLQPVMDALNGLTSGSTNGGGGGGGSQGGGGNNVYGAVQYNDSNTTATTTASRQNAQMPIPYITLPQPYMPERTVTRTGIDKRDVNVSVTGDALDPYLQRVMMRALMDIERG